MASPMVARQYSEPLGKTGNCQVGVSVQMVTDRASLGANWRLFCPASWDDTLVDDPAEAQRIRHAVNAPGSHRTCGTARNGGWRWTCSIR
jgi:DDE superfamily endonuclease